MAEKSLTEYPHPQQWYTINATALTWRELYRNSGNPISFLMVLPIMAVLKLIRVMLPSGVMPREVSFQTPGPVHPGDAARIQALLDEFAALGFEHFTSFAMPEIMGGAVMYVLFDRDRTAYADITYIPEKHIIYHEAFTPFNDGGGITTVVMKQATAVDTYPGKHIRYAGRVGPKALWERHQRSVQELAPQHGGIMPINEDEVFTHFRNDLRRYADFQASRGVFVPRP